MFLYLVQHGEAVTKEKDPERPLSSTGVVDVNKVAGFVAGNCGIVVGTKIHHSGKLRARQTAEIIAGALKLPGPELGDNLNPRDDPAVWQSRLSESLHDQVLIGHLPYMSRLVSQLLTGDPERGVVKFRMGGIVALRREEGLWSLQWMVVPEIIPGK